MYGQEVTYSKKITTRKVASEDYFVQLGEWEGTVATVIVNKQAAGIVAYPPYKLDITRFLKVGNNSIEVKVTGSLKNLLGPHHNSPKPGLVSPWLWRNVKQYPAGKDYDTYDYGLMKDFNIIRSRKGI
jgi:hypothetical protein